MPGHWVDRRRVECSRDSEFHFQVAACASRPVLPSMRNESRIGSHQYWPVLRVAGSIRYLILDAKSAALNASRGWLGDSAGVTGSKCGNRLVSFRLLAFPRPLPYRTAAPWHPWHSVWVSLRSKRLADERVRRLARHRPFPGGQPGNLATFTAAALLGEKCGALKGGSTGWHVLPPS